MVRHEERFIGPDGRAWVLERRDFGDGDVDYYLTEPDGRTTKVRRELV
jgi:hypothetical protein